jgi:hypothetical protein
VDNSLGDQHSLERAAAAEAAVRAPLSPRHAAGSPPHAHGGAVCRSTCPQGDARVSGRAYTHLCALGCHSPLERTTTPLSLSLSLSLSLTHRLAVHVFRRRRRRRRQQGGRTCCARARSSRRPVCWQRRACLCSGVCSRVPASWCCGPVRTPRDSPRASTSPRPPPWRRLTGSRTLPSGPSLPTAERRRTTGGRTQLLRLHPPSRGKTFWAGGRVHTPSRVPQPWGAPSCRQTDSLPCLLAGTVHWRQRSTSATATRHPWHSTSCSCRSLACRRWHRRGCAWR